MRRVDLGTVEHGEFRKPIPLNIENRRDEPVEVVGGFVGHTRPMTDEVTQEELDAQVCASLDRCGS